jgi:hypothetical protein
VLFTAVMSDYDIIELPLDGVPPRAVLATARSEPSPSRSAAGDQMALITDRSGQSEIWLRNPSGGWNGRRFGEAIFPMIRGTLLNLWLCRLTGLESLTNATARYGSPRCRVAAYRKHSQEANPKQQRPRGRPTVPRSPTLASAAASCMWQ